MGTHPSAPSRVVGQNTTLADLVKSDPASLLGAQISKAYANDLPFLFKVLSIRKALSIQAHPDKELAKKLHASRPDLYKDPNHKPEMAIALTDFEALCGFRPLSEIAENLDTYPEFAAVVGDSQAKALKDAITAPGPTAKEALRSLFAAMMNAEPATITSKLSALVARLKAGKPALPGSIDELVVRLDGQFPGGDIGCFAVMMLNYIRLKPDQAIYLGANEPHAYLSGGVFLVISPIWPSLKLSSLRSIDCVECMAASDNVVRSGLTPKHKDVETLVSMLTYSSGPAREQILEGDPTGKSGASRLYDPPIDEFSIIRTTVDGKIAEDEFEGIQGPSILVVTQGDATLESDKVEFPAGKGSIYFVGAGVPLKVKLQEGAKSGTLYRAYCSMA
jgi:mannose-6-phosphate isomerase